MSLLASTLSLHDWSDVVKIGQKVKMKFKDDLTSVTVVGVLCPTRPLIALTFTPLPIQSDC